MINLKFWLYRLKWKLAYIIDFGSPVHVDLETTTACHINCIMCHTRALKIKKTELDFETGKAIIDQCVEAGVKSIKFNWRGESLSNPWTWKLISYAKDKGLITYLNTSLSVYLSTPITINLARAIDVFKVSIDSISAYDKIRPNGKFSLVMGNLKEIAFYREKFKKRKIIISRRIVNIEKFETNREFKKFFKSGELKVKFDIRDSVQRNENQDIFAKWLQLEKGRRYCGHPSRRLVIGADGKVFICCVAYKEQDDLFLGNIKDKSIKELWASEKRKKKVLFLRNNKITDTCKDSCGSNDAYRK